MMAYPSDLGDPRYPHFMIFYINQNTRSKHYKQESTYNPPTDGQSRPLQENTGNRIGVVQEAGSVAQSLGFRKPYKRMKEAIALPIPNNIQASYGMNYTESEVNWVGNTVLANGGEFGEAGGAIGEGNVIEGISKILQGIGLGLEVAGRRTVGLASNLGISGDDAAIMGGITGKIDNPRTESLFKSTNIRTHNFQFSFMPQSKEEAKTILDIIKKFKMHMHPEIEADSVNSFLIVPDEFDIEFRYDQEANTSIAKIATCFLEAVDVNYTGTGSWVAFSGTDSPIKIDFSLRFREIEPLTRTQIEQGF
jgi:hypothetical protein